MDGSDRHVAVLLTGVGKRYDIVSAFAEHAFVVAADPSPLAPAQYAADVRVAPPQIDDLPSHQQQLEGQRASAQEEADAIEATLAELREQLEGIPPLQAQLCRSD